MSLMLDEWPPDEPPTPPLERRSRPWLAGVAGLVALHGIAGILISTDRAELLTPDARLVYVYLSVIGCIWALTAVLICGMLTAVRLLVHASRVRPEPSATRLRLW